MRHLVLGLCVLTASSGAYAQNYLPARDYSGPTTIVNMDVLQQGGSFGGGVSSFAPYAPAPVPPLAPAPILSMPLPPPDAVPAPLYAHVPSPMPLPVAPAPVYDEAPMAIVPHHVAPPIPSSDLGALPPADLVEPSPSISAPRQNAIAMVQELPPPSQMPSSAVAASSFAPIQTVAAAPVASSSSLSSSVSARPSLPDPVMPLDKDAIIPPAVSASNATVRVASLSTPSANAASVPSLSAAPVLPAPTSSSLAAKPAAQDDDFEAYRLRFDAGSSDLKASEKEVLNSIIAKMKQDPNIRLRMQAYAAGTPETTGQARRLSLARAMKIRSYMTENGIVATRLDVRALGMGSTSMNDTVARSNAPADRVDVIFMRG